MVLGTIKFGRAILFFLSTSLLSGCATFLDSENIEERGNGYYVTKQKLRYEGFLYTFGECGNCGKTDVWGGREKCPKCNVKFSNARQTIIEEPRKIVVTAKDEQTALRNAFLNSQFDDARKDAINRINDQDILTELVMGSEFATNKDNYLLYVYIIENKLTQESLRKVAMLHPDATFRKKASNALSSKELLYGLPVF